MKAEREQAAMDVIESVQNTAVAPKENWGAHLLLRRDVRAGVTFSVRLITASLFAA